MAIYVKNTIENFIDAISYDIKIAGYVDLKELERFIDDPSISITINNNRYYTTKYTNNSKIICIQNTMTSEPIITVSFTNTQWEEAKIFIKTAVGKRKDKKIDSYDKYRLDIAFIDNEIQKFKNNKNLEYFIYNPYVRVNSKVMRILLEIRESSLYGNELYMYIDKHINFEIDKEMAIFAHSICVNRTLIDYIRDLSDNDI